MRMYLKFPGRNCRYPGGVPRIPKISKITRQVCSKQIIKRWTFLKKIFFLFWFKTFLYLFYNKLLKTSSTRKRKYSVNFYSIPRIASTVFWTTVPPTVMSEGLRNNKMDCILSTKLNVLSPRTDNIFYVLPCFLLTFLLFIKLCNDTNKEKLLRSFLQNFLF